MELKKIKDIFDFEKGALQSSKCVPGKYDFITASSDWKKHETFDHDCEALVIAVAASGSLGRVHYVSGKFIASDLCFTLTPKNPIKFPVDLKFYFSIFQSLKADLVKKTATGTAKQAINRKNFGNYEIPYYPIDKQKALRPKFEKISIQQLNLESEIRKQLSDSIKLKETLLKDAIEGRLTADWRADRRSVETAAELLKSIKEKKSELIEAKIINKQSQLPDVTDKEKNFDLPDGWVWCRVGDLCDFITKGTTPPSSKFISGAGIPYLKVYNIVNQKIDFEYRPQFIDRNTHEKTLARSKVYPSDVLMNIVGPPLGKVALVPDDYPEWNINQALAIFRPIEKEMSSYIYYFLREGAPVRAVELRGVVGQDNISLAQSRELVIALPPLAEQREIVKRIENIYSLISSLEEELYSSMSEAEVLTRAVLSESFKA